MFIENKYTKWYFGIVENRKKNVLSNDIYTEKHHIYPASICPDKSTQKDNIVSVTAREHFILHWLLTKAVKDQEHKLKMLYAFSMFTTRKHKLTSKQYEIAKRSCSERMKIKWQDPEYRKKMSTVSKRAAIGRNVPKMLKERNDGSYEKYCESISKGIKGKPKSALHKEHLSSFLTGRTWIEKDGIYKHVTETQEFIADGWKIKAPSRVSGYTWINKEGKNKRVPNPEQYYNMGWEPGKAKNEKYSESSKKRDSIVRKCPHCGTEGRGAAMSRWHFSNCNQSQT